MTSRSKSSIINTKICCYKIEYATDQTQYKNAVVEIHTSKANTFGKKSNLGLESPYMGTVMTGQMCAYCRQTSYKQCYGHCGIVTNIPTYIAPAMLKLFVAVLNITCLQCGDIMLSNDGMEKLQSMPCHSMPNFYAILNSKIMPKYTSCPRCKSPVSKFKKHKDSFATVSVVVQHGVKHLLSKDIDTIVKALRESRHWNKIFHKYYQTFLDQIICRYLLVTPYSDRMYAFKPMNNTKQVPFLMFAYQSLISLIADYHVRESSSSEELADVNMRMFEIIKRIMFSEQKVSYNDPSQVMENNTSLLDIGKKHDFLRANVLTKTFLSVGRSTVICDNNLKPGTIRIPRSTAMELKIDCTITLDNIKALSAVGRNKTKWPCIFEIKRNGITYTDADVIFKSMTLTPGDGVKRSLMNNDLVITSRPPVLKNTNQHTNRVMVNEEQDPADSGFAMYSGQLKKMMGGDNDGDMIMIIPLSDISAISEMAVLLGVAENARSYKNGTFTLALTSNDIIGTYMATRYPSHIPFPAAVNLVGRCSLNSAERLRVLSEFADSKGMSTDFINAFIPDYVNMKGKTVVEKFDPNAESFEIRDGKIVSGVFGPNAGEDSPLTSLCEYLYVTKGAQTAIDVIHDIRLAVYAYMKMAGCGYTPMEGHIGNDNIDMIRAMESACRERVSAIFRVLDGTPHTRSQISGDPKSLKMVSYLDPFQYHDMILAAMPNGTMNRLLNLMVAMQKRTDNIVRLSGIGGIAIDHGLPLPKRVHNRLFSLNPSLSDRPIDSGYMPNGPFIGGAPKVTTYQAVVGSSALCDRCFLTRIPGQISRFTKNALSGIFCDAYGHLVVGLMINNPRVIMSAAGMVGGKPDSVGLMTIKEWVGFTPQVMQEKFTLPDNLGQSDLFDLYSVIYNEMVDDLNATFMMPNSAQTQRQMEILYHIGKNMTRIRMGDGPNYQCVVMLENFVKSLPYVFFGYDAYLDGIQVSDIYRHQVRNLMLMTMIYHPPVVVAMYDIRHFEEMLNYIYMRISDALLDPWMPVGCRASNDITEDLTQKTLDAPKSASGVAIELVQYRRWVMSNPPLGVETSQCIIDKPLGSYEKFIYKTLKDLSPHIKMQKYLDPKWQSCGYGKIDPGSNVNLMNIICTISRSNIKSSGLSAELIYTTLIKEFDGVVILLSLGVENMVILFQYEATGAMDTTSLVRFIENNIMNCQISGIKGIFSIKLQSVTVNHIKDGTLIEEKGHYLVIESNDMESLLRVPGVKYEKIIYENPGTQAKYFGIASAFVTMMHFISNMFSGQYASNALIYAAAATYTGSFVPINQYYINRVEKDHVLQDAALNKTKETIKMGAQSTDLMLTDDITTSMIMGSEVPIGSGAYCIMTKFPDKRYLEVPYDSDLLPDVEHPPFSMKILLDEFDDKSSNVDMNIND